MAQETEWIQGDPITSDKKDFSNFIDAASQKHGVPVSWIKGVIKVESSGNPRALSPKGARGLMQLMSKTARGLGWSTEDINDLYDPALNIDLGTKYIAELQSKYGRDLDKILSTYNSGSPKAYKTNPEVKSYVESVKKAMPPEELSGGWLQGDVVAKAPEKPYTPPGPTAGKLFIEGGKNVARGAKEFVTAVPEGSATAPENIAPLILGDYSNILSPIGDFASKGWTTLKGGIDYLTSLTGRPTSFGPPPESPEWTAAQKFAGANLASTLAPEIIAKTPGVVRAAVPYAEAAPTLLRETSKLAAKKAASAAGIGAISKIPGFGPEAASLLTAYYGVKTLPELMKVLKDYKAEVGLRKGARNVETIPSDVPRTVPSWKDIASRMEEPVDVESRPSSTTAVVRRGVPMGAAPDTSFVRGVPAEEPAFVEQPTVTPAPPRQLTGEIQEYPLIGARREPLLLREAAEPSTIATETAPATGGPAVGEAESALPAHYARMTPQTEPGTTALIGPQYVSPAGEQTVTPTTLREALRQTTGEPAKPSVAAPVTEPKVTPKSAAADYAKSINRNLRPQQITPDEALSKRISDYYEKTPSTPDDPAVKKAYKAFNKETHAQFKFLKKQGFKFEEVEGQPYDTVEDMKKDLANKTLKVSKDSPPAHGLMTPQQNFEFRAVHDTFGHAAADATFGHAGEETAYFAHKQMYTTEAQKAMATETRGQNAAVHFSEALKNPKETMYALSNAKGPKNFPEQKALILPDEFRNTKPGAKPRGPAFTDWVSKLSKNQRDLVRKALQSMEKETK